MKTRETAPAESPTFGSVGDRASVASQAVSAGPRVDRMHRLGAGLSLPPGRSTPPLSSELRRELEPSLYGFIWQISSRNQIQLCILAAALLPLSLLPLELQRIIVDDGIVKADLHVLLTVGLIYFVALIAHAALKYVFSVYQASVGEGVVRFLRHRINRAESHELRARVGSRITLAASEVEQVGGFAGYAVSVPVFEAGMLVTVVAYMLWLEPLMAGIAFLALLPSLLVTPVLQSRINRHLRMRISAVRRLSDHLLHVEPDSATRRGKRAERLIEWAYGHHICMFALKHLAKGLTHLMGMIGPLAILMVGGWFVMRGEAELGTVVAFISGVERLTTPAQELLNFYRRMTQAAVRYGLVVKTVHGSTARRRGGQGHGDGQAANAGAGDEQRERDGDGCPGAPERPVLGAGVPARGIVPGRLYQVSS